MKSYITSAQSPITDIQNLDESISSASLVNIPLKIILLGDISVGKTSIIRRFIEDDFINTYNCTMGVEFRLKSLILDEKHRLDLKIWDTCGEEKFRAITRQYYRDVNGVLLVFDLTNSLSFDQLNSWLQDLENCGEKDLSIIIIGNKCDLTIKREVDASKIKNFLKDKEDLLYSETSALTGEGIVDAFKTLCRKIMETNTIESIDAHNESLKHSRYEEFHRQMKIYNDKKEKYKNECC